MSVKNILIKNLPHHQNRQDRLDAIKYIMAQSTLKNDICLIIYQAQEDPAVIVEKWFFANEKVRKAFTESEAIALGPWPPSHHDDDLGILHLDSEVAWEE